MALVHVTSVNVLDNPAPFTNPFQFEITFESLVDLPEDLEWKITYVGSATDESYDQVLDTVMVGPCAKGLVKFVFQADGPVKEKIPNQDILGVTVVLLTCAYRGKEFIRVGYYVNNEYADPVLQENPPEVPDVNQIIRNVLAEKPRVTRINIDWD